MQFHPSIIHHPHYQRYQQRVQENMGNYYRNQSFSLADQTLFYPLHPVYGFPVYPQPGFDFRSIVLPSTPQYDYNHSTRAMYYPVNNSYYVNQPEILEWANDWEDEDQNQLQESDQDQGPNILFRFSLAPEEGTAILDLDGAFVNADGNLVSFSTSMPVDDAIVALQQLALVENDNNLSEVTISEHLKIRKYQTLADQDPEICVICQCEYQNEETIGTLECGHEYHADCIKSWLLEKNVCPLCKRTGIQQEN